MAPLASRMALMSLIILTFISATLVECLASIWVHYSERNKRIQVFFLGCALGLLTIVGLDSALHSMPCAVAFVLGYGLGGVLGIEIKKRLV